MSQWENESVENECPSCWCFFESICMHVLPNRPRHKSCSVVFWSLYIEVNSFTIMGTASRLAWILLQVGGIRHVSDGWWLEAQLLHHDRTNRLKHWILVYSPKGPRLFRMIHPVPEPGRIEIWNLKIRKPGNELNVFGTMDFFGGSLAQIVPKCRSADFEIYRIGYSLKRQDQVL